MAVVDLAASTITDEVNNEPWKVGGTSGEVLFATSGLATIASGNDDGSVYRICRVPSNARVMSIRLFTAGVTGGTAYEVGLYLSAGGAVKDADCYASAVNVTSAMAGTEVAFEARAITASRNKAWQDAGDSSDPGGYYDLALTGTTVGSADATILVQVAYLVI